MSETVDSGRVADAAIDADKFVLTVGDVELLANIADRFLHTSVRAESNGASPELARLIAAGSVFGSVAGLCMRRDRFEGLDRVDSTPVEAAIAQIFEAVPKFVEANANLRERVVPAIQRVSRELTAVMAAAKAQAKAANAAATQGDAPPGAPRQRPRPSPAPPRPNGKR